MKNIILYIFVIAFLCTHAYAEDKFGDPSFEMGSRLVELIPGDQNYPIYVADPRRPRTHAGIGYIDSDIPEISNSIVNLDAGTRFTLLKMHKGSESANTFSLDIEGGLFARFDLVNSFDNIGWDGRFGAYINWERYGPVVIRFGYRHLSSHVGDEYVKKTGRRRINYDRDDLRIGLGYRFANNALVYVEPSYAFHLGNTSRQDNPAVEGGIQYQGPYKMWKGSTGLYTGLHVSSYDENGWNPSISGQLGLKIKRDPEKIKLRVGFEGYVGRAIIGEYALDYDESYLTVGFSVEY